MGVIISFNYTNWLARYPEFATVAQASVVECFNEATMYVRNDGGGPVCNTIQQTTFLNMVTAHIVALNFGVNGQAATPLVGNITNATEGSVSVGVTNDYPPGTVQWFQSTKYGAAYWTASAPYRTMRYLPKPSRIYTGPYYGY